MLKLFESALRAAYRAVWNRIEISRLKDLDDYALRDMGLTGRDVITALNSPLYRDPSRLLKRLCCGAAQGRFQPSHASG